jgi:hypothetical protein
MDDACKDTYIHTSIRSRTASGMVLFALSSIFLRPQQAVAGVGLRREPEERLCQLPFGDGDEVCQFVDSKGTALNSYTSKSLQYHTNCKHFHRFSSSVPLFTHAGAFIWDQNSSDHADPDSFPSKSLKCNTKCSS